MNIEYLVIYFLFAGALFLVGRRAYQVIFKRKAGGCAKCDQVK